MHVLVRFFDIGPNGLTQIFVLEGKMDIGLNILGLIARVPIAPAQLVCVHRQMLGHQIDALGIDDLAGRRRFCLFKIAEKVGGENCSAEHSESGRGFTGGWFFDNAGNREGLAAGLAFWLNDSVLMKPILTNGVDADDGAAMSSVGVHKLSSDGNARLEKIVTPTQHKRFITDDFFSHQDRVAIPQRFILPDENKFCQLGNAVNLFQLFQFIFFLEHLFKFTRIIEMVFDRPLIPTGHENNLLNSGGDHLLDNVLDDRLIDNGEHFFRLGDCHRQKPRAETGHGNDDLAYLLEFSFCWHSPLEFINATNTLTLY